MIVIGRPTACWNITKLCILVTIHFVQSSQYFPIISLYILIYSIQLSPSWKANRFSASQETPRTVWKLKIHCRIHKCPPPVTVLSQINPRPHPTSWRSILILYRIYSWVLQAISFPQATPPKPCTRLSSAPYMLPAPPIPFFKIWSTEWYFVRSTDH